MIYGLALTALLLCFLINLIRYLRGRSKTQILFSLTIACLVVVVSVFVIYGWKATLVFAVGMMLAIKVLEPVGVRLAARVLAKTNYVSYVSYPGLPSGRLKKISRRLVFSRHSHIDELINYCLQDANVRKTINDSNLEPEDLTQLYYNLIEVGAGQWRGGHFVAASSLAYPKCLKISRGKLRN